MGAIRRWFARGRNIAVDTSQVDIRPELRDFAIATKGFLEEEEGLKLFSLARACAHRAPCLEVGSYCGKSTLFLAEGCRAAGVYSVFSVDHHRGSAEQQPGELYHDPDLYDSDRAAINTLPHFYKNLAVAGLLDWAIPMVGDSAHVARNWSGALSLVFIDGSHAEEDVKRDYDCWSKHVIPGGYLCFHDVITNPEAGGQAPRRVFERAQTSRMWQLEGLFWTLGVLRRR